MHVLKSCSARVMQSVLSLANFIYLLIYLLIRFFPKHSNINDTLTWLGIHDSFCQANWPSHKDIQRLRTDKHLKTGDKSSRIAEILADAQSL